MEIRKITIVAATLIASGAAQAQQHVNGDIGSIQSGMKGYTHNLGDTNRPYFGYVEYCGPSTPLGCSGPGGKWVPEGWGRATTGTEATSTGAGGAGGGGSGGSGFADTEIFEDSYAGIDTNNPLARIKVRNTSITQTYYTLQDVERMREAIAEEMYARHPAVMKGCPPSANVCWLYDQLPESMRETVEIVLRMDLTHGLSPEALEDQAK